MPTRMAEDLDRALSALRGGRIPAGSAAEFLPAGRGLYAVWAPATAWMQLDVGKPVGQPLYVGKAEKSLRHRVAGTHLRSGRTGSSTLRRTLAALLRADQQLIARPRNPERPAQVSNYGLDEASEQRLQTWIDQHLEVAVWTPVDDQAALGRLEHAAIVAWPAPPPLNLSGLEPTAAATQIRIARREMADSAATWRARP